jgi:hypothetical protein
MVERVAEAIRKASEDHLFELLGDIEARPEEFLQMFESLLDESDRAISIVSYAYLDSRLRDLFEGALNKEITGGVESLLGPLRPLGTGSARIQVAAALFWISASTYKDFDILRKIRNEFAHNPGASSLNQERLAGLLSSLSRSEDAVLRAVEYPIEVLPLTPRQILFLRTVLVGQRLVCEMATAPRAQRLGLHPHTALRQGFERLPENLKSLARAASKAAMKCLRTGIPVPGTK